MIDLNIPVRDAAIASLGWEIYEHDRELHVDYMQQSAAVLDIHDWVHGTTLKDVLWYHVEKTFVPFMAGRFNDLCLRIFPTRVECHIKVEEDWQKVTCFAIPYVKIRQNSDICVSSEIL
jgi:hypothetical protein